MAALLTACTAPFLPVDLRAQAPLRATTSPEDLPDTPSVVLQQTTTQTTPQQTKAPTPTNDAPVPGRQTTSPPEETPAQRKARENAESEAILKKEEQQRLLGVVPNFNVVYEGQVVPPLTPREKFSLAIHTTVDPFTIAYAFVGAGYSEVADTHNGFGWGPAGYFKRVGSGYADTVNGALIGNALLPVLLHQDPRYFRQGTGTIQSRFIHAALSTVICHGDNGKNQVNISNVLGNYISGAISNAYYPANERGVGLTLENGTEVTLYGAVGGQILEFAPDIINHFKNRHRRKISTPNISTP